MKKIKSTIKTILILTISLLFISCSDKSSSTVGDKKYNSQINKKLEKIPAEYSNITIQGKAIDAEIAGAMVFLDLNDNGILNKDEPYTNTDEYGYYDLKLTTTQAMHTKIVNKTFNIIYHVTLILL